nr:MAG TPA: hypothetical protein [Caudoviricetes sp.]
MGGLWLRSGIDWCEQWAWNWQRGWRGKPHADN